MFENLLFKNYNSTFCKNTMQASEDSADSNLKQKL